MDTVDRFGPGGGRVLKEDSAAVNMADKAEEYLGGKGFDVISDTDPHVPAAGLCYCALQVLTNTVISAHAQDVSAPITGTLTGVTLLAGIWIFGKYNSLTLTSGSLLAYNGAL
jgi:hypothetical protein